MTSLTLATIALILIVATPLIGWFAAMLIAARVGDELRDREE